MLSYIENTPVVGTCAATSLDLVAAVAGTKVFVNKAVISTDKDVFVGFTDGTAGTSWAKVGIKAGTTLVLDAVQLELNRIQPVFSTAAGLKLALTTSDATANVYYNIYYTKQQ